MVAEPGYLPSAGDQIGGFTLLEPIGHGAMGQVYRAHDETLGREVAIKFIDISGLNNENLINQVKKRFIREARVLAAVNHPNVVEIFTASLGFRCPYIVMQYFEGSPLFEYQDSMGAVDYKRCSIIGLQICEALDYCWENYQIMHRDLKPANILIDRTGHIKIIDWGIAKVTKDIAMDASFVTKSDMRLGTPYFMAPEQQINPGDVTYLADIYSMGMILWQMLAGDLPFTAKSEAVIFSQKQKGPERNLTDLIPELPAPIAEIIYKMLEPNPEKRLSSYAEVRNVLQAEINKFSDKDELFPKRVVLKPSVAQVSKPVPASPIPPPAAAKPASPPPEVAKPVFAKPITPPPAVKAAIPIPIAKKPATPEPAVKIVQPIPIAKKPSQTAPPPEDVPSATLPRAVPAKPPKAKVITSSISTPGKIILDKPPAVQPDGLKGKPMEDSPEIAIPESNKKPGLVSTEDTSRIDDQAGQISTESVAASTPEKPKQNTKETKSNLPKAIQVAGPEDAFGSDLIEPKPPTESINIIKREDDGSLPPLDTIPAPYLRLIRLLDCQSVDKEIWPGKEIGQYQIIEKLGMGSLGVVFRAEDMESHQDISLKALICDPDSVRSRVSDIQDIESKFEGFKHQSITPSQKCSSIDGYSLIIGDLHLGQDGHPVNLLNACQAYGTNDGVLNQYDTRSLLLIVLDALQHAHSQGVCHGNLKPENIIFPPNNGTRRKWYSDLKVTDLGLVSIVGPQIYHRLLRKARHYVNVPHKMRDDISAMLRTYEYMSPESREHGEITTTADLYSVGLITLLLLTGRNMAKMGVKPSEMRTGISEDWDHIIIKALREDPGNRYQSADEMAADIANLPF